MLKLIDTSKELLISPFEGGIKLIPPSEHCPNNLINIGSILKLPFNVFFHNKNGIVQNVNESTIINCNLISKKCILGKDYSFALDKETVLKFIQNDLNTINNKKLVICEENVIRLDDISFSVLSFKFPWHDNNNQAVGIFGCSVIIKEDNIHELISCIYQIRNVGLFSSHSVSSISQNIILGNVIDNIYLSKREIECITYLSQGYTAKMTAQALHISFRTVEYYIETAKHKLNVHSKSELLEKVRNTYLTHNI